MRDWLVLTQRPVPKDSWFSQKKAPSMGKPNSQWVHRGRHGPLAHQQQPVGRWVVRTTQRPLSELPHKKMPGTPSFLWTSFGAVIGFSTLLERAREIDWLLQGGTKTRALGHQHDPTTGVVFTEEGAKHGQTKQSMGSQREDVGLGSSATTGHPCVGRWVVPTTQRPALRAATDNKMPETASSFWGASFGTAGSGWVLHIVRKSLRD